MFAGEPAPFVMELPAYHMPTVGAVLRSMWERGWSFIKKAGTIILLSTIVLWFLMSFGWADGSFGMLEAEQLDSSILAKIGSVIAWIFTPLGWTQAGEGWKMAVAAVTGLIAKENVVATFGMLFGFAEVAEDGAEVWGSLAAVMTPVAAFGFLAFNLLCAPCFAAMGAIKRDEQPEMVLVCHWLPDRACLCGSYVYLSDWYTAYGWRIRNRYSGGASSGDRIPVSSVQTLQGSGFFEDRYTQDCESGEIRLRNDISGSGSYRERFDKI